jgi:hypothetical protein
VFEVEMEFPEIPNLVEGAKIVIDNKKGGR